MSGRALRSLFLAIATVLAFGPTHSASAGSSPCVRRTFEQNQFTVCAFDADRDTLRLAWTDSKGSPLRSFGRLAGALGTEKPRVRFAMNAGMFDDRGDPVGLYVDRGSVRVPLNQRSGDGNFYLLPNGVFWEDEKGAVGVDTSEHYAASGRAPRWATQSGPMLVIDGALNPQISPDGPSKLIRNGVGVRDPRHALFVISEYPVSFGRFALFFRDGLGCRNALYLDGTVSSLWIPLDEREDHAYPLGPIIVVLDR